MDNLEILTNKHFKSTSVKIDMDATFKVMLEYKLTEKELEDIFCDIEKNLSFFEKELGVNGLVISNLLNYACNAIYVPNHKWNGSINRKRITKEYQSILNEENMIDNVAKKDIHEIIHLDNEQRTFRNFTKEILWVGDEHRTHPWSMRPGGATVVVVYLTGKVLGYDKVKRPDRYIPMIFRGDKESIYSKWEERTLYKYLSDYVESIGAARPDSDEIEILYRNGDNVNILDKLKYFRTE